MEKRPTSAVRYESRTTVDRPIEAVFARVADLRSYGNWMHRTGLFRRCGQASDDPLDKAGRRRNTPLPANDAVEGCARSPHLRAE